MVTVCFCGSAAGTAFPGSPSGVVPVLKVVMDPAFVPGIAPGVSGGAEGSTTLPEGAGVLLVFGAGVFPVVTFAAAPGCVKFSVEAVGGVFPGLLGVGT